MKKPHPSIDYDKLAPITPEIRRRVKRADPADTVSPSISVADAPPGVRVGAVSPGSVAQRAGIQVGEKLISINREPIRDTIDFYFHGAEFEMDIVVEDRNGETRVVRIAKDSPEEHLGIEIEQFTTQNCGCNCVFCFVHQLPDNLRKSLYIKDEDYRLSFLQGSYITGVTLKESDLERIAAQRLSPLYISVHAVDESLRRWLLGIRKAQPILEVLDFFRAHRIEVHTQIVLCPGHNDGEQLDRTLDALLDRYPTVQSVAIVPIGMTKWRQGLPDMESVTPEYARRFIGRLAPRLRAIADRFGEPVVLLADEWYLIAGRRAPSYTRWPDLPQLENGVGMVYHFYKDLPAANRVLAHHRVERPWRVGAITSTLSPPVLDRITRACLQHRIEVVALPTINTLFGETIHVTGLLAGVDLSRTIRDNPGFDQYLLPGNCVRREDHRFLDDMTLEQLQGLTEAPVTPVMGGALDFVETILEQAGEYERATPQDHVFLAGHWANT